MLRYEKPPKELAIPVLTRAEALAHLVGTVGGSGLLWALGLALRPGLLLEWWPLSLVSAGLGVGAAGLLLRLLRAVQWGRRAAWRQPYQGTHPAVLQLGALYHVAFFLMLSVLLLLGFAWGFS